MSDRIATHHNFRFPLDYNIIRSSSVSNTFGMVRHNADGSTRSHQGWDFTAEIGKPSYPVQKATYASSGDHKDYGIWIQIKLACGLYAFYSHMQDINEKDHYEMSDIVGHTGNSGNASNLKPSQHHLHFELRNKFMPGVGLKGLTNRISPMVLLEICPLRYPIIVK